MMLTVKTKIRLTALIIISSTIMFFLTSCVEFSKEKLLKNYVEAYEISKKGLAIDIIENDLKNDNVILRVSCRHPQLSKSVSSSSVGEDKRFFDSLCIKNGDISYDKIVFTRDLEDIQHARNLFFADKVVDIAITCNKDWNSDYPAGSLLNDIFYYFSCSPDSFIKNGYKNAEVDLIKVKKDIDNRFIGVCSSVISYSGHTSLPIYGKLSEIDFSQYNLIGISATIGWFAWIVSPEDQMRNINIDITFESGEKVMLTKKLNE